MYSGVALHFNVNGVIDSNSAHPKNGIAQGCPASPCFYLLCIQGLISLLKRDQLRPNGIKGIDGQTPYPMETVDATKKERVEPNAWHVLT